MASSLSSSSLSTSKYNVRKSFEKNVLRRLPQCMRDSPAPAVPWTQGACWACRVRFSTTATNDIASRLRSLLPSQVFMTVPLSSSPLLPDVRLSYLCLSACYAHYLFFFFHAHATLAFSRDIRCHVVFSTRDFLDKLINCCRQAAIASTIVTSLTFFITSQYVSVDRGDEKTFIHVKRIIINIRLMIGPQSCHVRQGL